MIKVNNLNKYYNKGKSNQIHVIDDTSIELPSKGLITFLGHSGSGKTTLLNVIGGLDKANSGEIVYDDVEFKKYNMSKIDKFRSRHIGYVFQNYNLLLEETVYDNLRIALDLIGITDIEEQKKRIEYSLKAVGMYKYRKKIASFLSGGQQQRVSIARALIKKSLVIIADEPTGNLDSKNTMEVMNILKKISEQALVLLVTHEDNVANFYSDLIYEIKDGKIVGKREIRSDATFDTQTSDETIYLKDLNENEYQSELGNIMIHSDSDEPLKINFDIIVKNGNIYLKTDKPIKLVEQTDLRIVNDNYKEMKREDISSFEYDTSWFDDKKEEPKIFKKLGKRLYNAFISFKAVGKKQKFIYLCLAFIGFIMGIGFSLFSNAVTFDMTPYSYSNNINYLDRTTPTNTSAFDVLNDAYDSGEIDDIYTLVSTSVLFNYQVTVDYSIKQEFRTYVIPSFENNTDISLGKRPLEITDIVISTDIAQTIAKKTSRAVEDVIGLNMSIDKQTYKISGISKNDNLMVYLSPSAYELLDSTFSFNEIYYVYETNDISLNKMWYKETLDYYICEGFVFQNNSMRSKKYETYEILSGRDVDMDTSEYEFVVSSSSGRKIGDKISLNAENSSEHISGTIVGYFKDFDYSSESTIIVNKDIKYVAGSEYSLVTKGGIFDNSSNVKIVEGRYPKNKNEIIVSVYSAPINYPYSVDKDLDFNYNVGDKVYITGKGECTIVGKFNSGKFHQSILFNSNDYTLSFSGVSSSTVFNVLKSEEFNKRLEDAGFANIGLYKAIYNAAKESRAKFIEVFTEIFAVTAISAALFVYFVMRSKMLSDIYNIGVYRSLGASRFRINRKYMSDILVLSTLTCLIGYVFGVLVYISISGPINSLFVEVSNQSVFSFNIGIGISGGFVIYGIMFLFGMLPILTLETKTPSEIIAKYDI